jgi:phosphoribosyl-dephospho-CoA transferase
VWLNLQGWKTLQSTYSCFSQSINFWRQHHFPLVVRRLDADLSSQAIAVGIPLPPGMGKHRLALSIEVSHIDSYCEPLSLSDVISFAPKIWQEQLESLNQEIQKLCFNIKVYGSLAWQALTKLDYIHPSSDIDCLVQIENQRQFSNALKILKHFSSSLPLDGEFIFFKNSAVAWKELITESHPQPSTLLVKTINSVSLVDREDFFRGIG